MLGLEQFGIPNARGSHHGHSRVFRTAYFEHADYVPLLRRAHERWVEMDRRVGGGVYFETGALYAGPRGCVTVEGAMKSARTHGLEAQRLESAEVKRRYPQFALPEGFEAIHEARAGFLVPEVAVSAYARAAMGSGAELRGHEAVIGWSADDKGVRVRTARGEYEAGNLIITAGAWAGKVIADLGVQLRITRQVMAWYWPRVPELFEMPGHLVWAIENERGQLHYGFPMQRGASPGPGLKIALHEPGAVVDPDTVDRSAVMVGVGVGADDEEQTRGALRRYFPQGDGPLLSMAVCLYANSPDGHLIIDRHPRHPNVAIACGSSGHGFKFAPVFGEILADLAMHGGTVHRAGFLGLGRFGK